MKEVKKNVVLSFRGDLKDIADLVLVFESLFGERVHSKSEVIRVAVSEYAELLRLKFKDKVKFFPSLDSAVDYLVSLGLLSVAELKRNAAKLRGAKLEEIDVPVSRIPLPTADEEVRKRARELLGGEE